ncbi:M50 family metallopeptidase [Clostridium sp. A1-XYC3]|uniref:M50 family metallopeptidase n=1 Tax=Clostridium tanneri TaxID=3037988 RepID=A0ABU4JP15_9CLOT|nr:M50 family metallopeptidase [Clostridium sp. A1-XYC3]MDW8799857.1 M50 family metallopeptidase [Clostridium sp. A1-XYC3]
MVRVSKYFIPYIIFLIIIGYKGQLFYSFLIVVLHEIAHYIAARYYGFSGFDIEFLAIGAALKFRELDEASPKEDLIISMAGPMLNIALAVIFYFLYKNFKLSGFNIFFQGNLAIGLFNLIPAFPLDGGRILRDLLNFKTTFKKANKIMINTGILMGAILMFIYILLFLKESNNFNVGIIGLFIIVSSLREKERISYIIMGDIIKKKYKFIKNGYIENKNTSVYYKNDMLSLMSIFDKNKYNIFTILDEEMKVMDIIYEEEVVNTLKVYGNITIEEFIKNEEERK